MSDNVALSDTWIGRRRFRSRWGRPHLSPKLLGRSSKEPGRPYLRSPPCDRVPASPCWRSRARHRAGLTWSKYADGDRRFGLITGAKRVYARIATILALIEETPDAADRRAAPGAHKERRDVRLRHDPPALRPPLGRHRTHGRPLHSRRVSKLLRSRGIRCQHARLLL